MADVYYGINRGQTEFSAVEASSTSSTDIEVRVDTTKFPPGKQGVKHEVVQALQMLINTIVKDAAEVWG